MTEKRILVPLGGNTFLTNKPQSAPDGVTKDGIAGWKNEKDEYHIYFKIKHDARLGLRLQIRKASADAVIAAGLKSPEKEYAVRKGDVEIDLGVFQAQAGYVDVALRGVRRNAGTFAHPTALAVSGVGEEDAAAYAHEEDKKDFYWIRRGPSVHCGYDLSQAGDDVEWFYNEVTVMPGEDPHGTYAMAIGFHGGYYGMQVCDEGKRKLLFSIWSPYRTDDPNEIPEEQRVKVLKKHPLVRTGEFGNEGSGGQSFMDYDWVSGVPYRFLVRIRPAREDKTEFTSYFYFPETQKWELFCSFLRPQTQTWFKGAHSFLESFLDVNGHRYRKAFFRNQWAVTKGGLWLPVTKMRLTGDATARRSMRQDYGGGVQGDGFFLHNCGFFPNHDPLDAIYAVTRNENDRPQIDLEALEKPE